nr:hypothetical protein [Streptomyces sp. 13-12-16]
MNQAPIAHPGPLRNQFGARSSVRRRVWKNQVMKSAAQSRLVTSWTCPALSYSEYAASRSDAVVVVMSPSTTVRSRTSVYTANRSLSAETANAATTATRRPREARGGTLLGSG